MPKRIWVYITVGFLTTLGIFVIDLLTPKGIALGVVYLGMIFVALIIKRLPIVLAFATVATALVFTGYFLSPSSEDATTGLINLGITLFIIWLAAAMLIYHLAQEKKYTEKLAELANHDALTGVHNRHYFNQELEKEIAKSRRYKIDLSLFIVDIDHFKQVNDTYGHPIGDQVLKSLAMICKDVLRDVDIVVRFGGEEFIVILPSTNLGGAVYTAERIRKAIEGHDFSFDDVSLKCTVSVGVASHENKDWNDKDLIKAADIALYEAKKQGRNLVREFNEDITDLRHAFGKEEKQPVPQ